MTRIAIFGVRLSLNCNVSNDCKFKERFHSENYFQILGFTRMVRKYLLPFDLKMVYEYQNLVYKSMGLVCRYRGEDFCR